MAVTIIPQTGKITLAQKGQNSVIVTMDKLLSDIGLESFAIYMDGEKVGTTKSQTFTYTFKGNDFLGEHDFSVKTVYPDGQDFDFAEKSITVKDVTAPKAGKISLTQTASSQVKISISGFSDNAGIDRYDIYLGSKKVGSTTSASFTCTNSSMTGKQTFTVKAVDDAGNTSSGAAASITLDKTAPKTGKIKLAQSGQNNVKITISGFSDNVKIARYDVYLGSTKVGSTTSKSYTYKGKNLIGKKTFSVKAVDTVGNTSKAASASVTIKDITAPTAGKIKLAQSGQNKIKITMSGFTDNVKVTRYNVYLGSKKIGSTTSTSYTYKGKNLIGKKTFSVKAADATGKVSATVKASITAKDITAPKAGKIKLAQSGQNNIKITMRSFSDNVKVAKYDIYLDGKKVASSKKASYTYKGKNLYGKKKISVKALDAAGNASKAVAASIKIKDITAPKTGKITLTQTAATSVKITISGFSDNVKIAKYNIYLGKKKIASTTSTSYTYTSSSVKGKLTFSVKAVDTAGKTSAAASKSISVVSALKKTVGGIACATYENYDDKCHCSDDSLMSDTHISKHMPSSSRVSGITGTKYNDVVTFSAKKSRIVNGSISLADGNDKITFNGGTASDFAETFAKSCSLGNGSDTIDIKKYAEFETRKLDFGSGDDKLNIAECSEIEFLECDFDAGNDILTCYGELKNEYDSKACLDMGSGNDKVSFYGNNFNITHNLNLGEGNDTLNIGKNCTLFETEGGIVWGKGSDTLNLEGTLQLFSWSNWRYDSDSLETIKGKGTLAFSSIYSDVEEMQSFSEATGLRIVNTDGSSGFFRGYEAELNDSKISGSSVQTVDNNITDRDEINFWLCGANRAKELNFGLTDSVDYVKYVKRSGDEDLEIEFNGKLGKELSVQVLNAKGKVLSGSKYAFSADGSYGDFNMYDADVSKWSNSTYYLKLQVASNTTACGYVFID